MLALAALIVGVTVANAQTPAPSSSPAAAPSLASTNPTAIPLNSIGSSMAPQPTVALDSMYQAGATPPVSGAPPLPSAVIVPANYPALDQVPPVDSQQVQQWKAEVASSGVKIPDIPPTVAGGCGTNTAAAANASASGTCWWTCGECSRETDITTCPDKATWGLSFDDGPSPYTPDLLNYLDAASIKSTFFIVGSRAISRPQILQSEYMAGHQLSVHTWSHPSLTTLTNDQIIAELGWTKYAIKQITGVTPNTMRPPYGDIDDRVRAISQAMGLTPIIWTSVNGADFDTNDWHIPSGFPATEVLNSFEKIMDTAGNLSTGFIVLSHDLYQQTVDMAIGYTLPDARARKFNLMSIIDCLKKPLGDAYIETSSNSSSPAATGTSSTNPVGLGTSPTSATTAATTRSSDHNSADRRVGSIIASLIGVALAFSLL